MSFARRGSLFSRSKLRHVFEIRRRQARTLARVALRLAHPSSERLLRAADLLRHGSDCPHCEHIAPSSAPAPVHAPRAHRTSGENRVNFPMTPSSTVWSLRRSRRDSHRPRAPNGNCAADLRAGAEQLDARQPLSQHDLPCIRRAGRPVSRWLQKFPSDRGVRAAEHYCDCDLDGSRARAGGSIEPMARAAAHWSEHGCAIYDGVPGTRRVDRHRVDRPLNGRVGKHRRDLHAVLRLLIHAENRIWPRDGK